MTHAGAALAQLAVHVASLRVPLALSRYAITGFAPFICSEGNRPTSALLRSTTVMIQVAFGVAQDAVHVASLSAPLPKS
jgi:hypothetical protein